MAYHQFINEDGEPYGSFETIETADGEWFWQACFPGCLPDGDPVGPFITEIDAIADAMNNGG